MQIKRQRSFPGSVSRYPPVADRSFEATTERSRDPVGCLAVTSAPPPTHPCQNLSETRREQSRAQNTRRQPHASPPCGSETEGGPALSCHSRALSALWSPLTPASLWSIDATQPGTGRRFAEMLRLARQPADRTTATHPCHQSVAYPVSVTAHAKCPHSQNLFQPYIHIPRATLDEYRTAGTKLHSTARLSTDVQADWRRSEAVWPISAQLWTPNRRGASGSTSGSWGISSGLDDW